MTSRMRAITLSIATALAAGTIGAAPAYAADPWVAVGNTIYVWSGGSESCPETLTIPSSYNGSTITTLSAATIPWAAINDIRQVCALPALEGVLTTTRTPDGRTIRMQPPGLRQRASSRK